MQCSKRAVMIKPQQKFLEYYTILVQNKKSHHLDPQQAFILLNKLFQRMKTIILVFDPASNGTAR